MTELSSEDISLIKISATICLVLLSISGGLYLCGSDPNYIAAPMLGVAVMMWACGEAIGKRDMRVYNN